MQGDQVLVEVEPPKADGRRMAGIVRILERRNPTVLRLSLCTIGPVRKAILSFPSTAHDAGDSDSRWQELPLRASPPRRIASLQGSCAGRRSREP